MTAGLAIESVAALPPQTATSVGAPPGHPQVELMAQPAPQPSAAEAADFANAARAGAAPAEVMALPPARAEAWGGSLVHRLEAAMAHMKMPEAGTGGLTPETAGPAPTTLNRDAASAAVAQMERAYMFAIETTMASRGSTETTKIFNTLLKGQ